MSLSTRGGGGATNPNTNIGDDAGTAMEFDAEYEALMALKLASKETKYDFKAQIAVAKDFTVRAKSLMRDMRGALSNSSGAVQAAYDQSAADIKDAQDAAADAAKERDEIQRALDAARAEAVSSATQLAQAVKREQTSTKAAEENRKVRLGPVRLLPPSKIIYFIILYYIASIRSLAQSSILHAHPLGSVLFLVLVHVR